MARVIARRFCWVEIGERTTFTFSGLSGHCDGNLWFVQGKHVPVEGIADQIKQSLSNAGLADVSDKVALICVSPSTALKLALERVIRPEHIEQAVEYNPKIITLFLSMDGTSKEYLLIIDSRIRRKRGYYLANDMGTPLN